MRDMPEDNVWRLTPEQMAEFEARLDEEPRVLPELAALMARTPPWDDRVKAALGSLNGSDATAVSLMTGLSPEALADLGGVPED